jgi:hypothetical protein
MRKSKYVVVDFNSPSSSFLGTCEYTGFVMNRDQLTRQKDWRGNSFIWTGLIVGKKFADKPQEQNRPPITKADPFPIKDPRFPAIYTSVDSNPAPSTQEIIQQLNNVHWD